MVTSERRNLDVLEPSRRVLRPGDVFALRPHDGPYIFGRVIKTDVDFSGYAAVLIYIYKATSPTPDRIPSLRRDNLLIPPLLTNRLPWARGYFKTIDNVPLTPWDTFKIHGFADPLDRSRILDESGRPVENVGSPIGIWGLHSYRTIDDAVSDALGIPRVAD